MTTRHAGFSLLLALSSFGGQATAQVIDQQNQSVENVFAVSQFWAGQTFTPTASTSAGAGVWLEGYNGNVSLAAFLEAQLWTGMPAKAGSTRLSSAASSFTIIGEGPSSGAFVDVFWNPVAVTPGVQYFLAFRTTNSTYSAVFGFTGFPSYADSYAGGEIQYCGFEGEEDCVNPYAGYPYDLSFREYSSSVVATPEPASITLLAIGLAGFAVFRQRMRSTLLASR